jgi:HEAT repeat protein
MGAAANAAIPALQANLKSADVRVRCHAAQALWRIDGQAGPIVPVLIAALRDPNRNVRLGVLTTLAQMGAAAKPAVEALRTEVSNEEDPEVSLQAAHTLWRIAPDQTGEVAKALGKVLVSNDGALQTRAALALGEMGSKAVDAMPALNIAMHNSDPTIARYATAALGQIGQAAVPDLSKALADANVSVRTNAAAALAQMGPAAAGALPALKKALTDSVPTVRGAACLALGGIGAPAKSAIPDLTNMLKDKYGEVRRCAAQALGDFGKEAGAALPELKAIAQNDPSIDAAGAAQQAVWKIEKAEL